MDSSVERIPILDDAALWQRLRELAAHRRRFSRHRLQMLFKRKVQVVHHKRTKSIYKEDGLTLRRKLSRKRASRHQGHNTSP